MTDVPPTSNVRFGTNLRGSPQAALMRQGIEQIQAEIPVSPEFSAEVESEASGAAARPRLPSTDRTDIELVTIDPSTARDLDQALHIEAPDGLTRSITRSPMLPRS